MFLTPEAIEIKKKIRLRQAQKEWAIDCEIWRAKIQEEIKNAKPLDPSYYAHTFNPGSSSSSYVPKQVSPLHQKLAIRHLGISKEQT